MSKPACSTPCPPPWWLRPTLRRTSGWPQPTSGRSVWLLGPALEARQSLRGELLRDLLRRLRADRAGELTRSRDPRGTLLLGGTDDLLDLRAHHLGAHLLEQDVDGFRHLADEGGDDRVDRLL